MRAGKRDRRIVIQVRGESRAPSGEVIEGWTDFATVWARKFDKGAGERFAAAQKLAEVDTIFEIVHRAGLTAIAPDTHRIVFAGRVYEILGRSEVARNQSIDIMTAARAEAAFGS